MRFPLFTDGARTDKVAGRFYYDPVQNLCRAPLWLIDRTAGEAGACTFLKAEAHLVLLSVHHPDRIIDLD